MSKMVFGKTYSDQYDLLYQNKDYAAECDMLEQVFARYHKSPVKTILDLGCGTGNHALPLAKRGYTVIGVDSSIEMLARANNKTECELDAETSARVRFLYGDVRNFRIDQKFDVVIMMFAVLGYQLTNEDVTSALHTVRQHLKPGGLFLCDVWYGPAVLTIRPEERIKVIPTETGKLIRAASGTLDLFHHLCEVQYQLWNLKGNQVLSETTECHHMRYFFPQELALFFGQEQFSVLNICSFDDPNRVPDETTWNILVVGKAL